MMNTMNGLQFLLILSSLALTLSPLLPSVSADVFFSLNCGSSTAVTDGNSIVWLGDTPYIQNGATHSVSTPSTFSPVMSTLRSFTTRKKNCYSFEVDKGSRILFRATFFYGNYDKKSSPPSFDLHFDGNYWTTVETSTTDVVYYEVVYIAKGDVASVCLAQTKTNQFPFISGLEIRSMDESVYSDSDSDKPLYLIKRVAYGAKAMVRFPDDAYDRIWRPARLSNDITTVTSDAIIISTTGSNDMPPTAVLRNAMTASSLSTLTILPGLPSTPVPIFMNMYFSEVSQLDSTDKRSFQTSIDNKIGADEPVIIPPYGEVVELYTSNISASSTTTFDLVPTSDSTLPPLLNALEVFMVGPTLSEGTDSNDVAGLALLQESFTKLQEWSGDPCLPARYTWEWVTCSSDPVPRVTSLLLSDLGLVGPLPDFSGMDALETIDMNKNSLSDEIPDFLGAFPKLKELNLADNDFLGAIPSSLSTKKSIKLDLSGNPNLCTSGKSCKTATSGTGADTGTGTSSYKPSSGTRSTRKKKKVLPVVLGTVLPIFFVFWGIVGFLLARSHRRKAAASTGLTAGQNGGKPAGVPSNTPVHPGTHNGQAYDQNANATSTNVPYQAYQDVPASYASQDYQQNIPPPSPGGDYTEVPLYTETEPDVESGIHK